jgi:hypothetical protein
MKRILTSEEFMAEAKKRIGKKYRLWASTHSKKYETWIQGGTITDVQRNDDSIYIVLDGNTFERFTIGALREINMVDNTFHTVYNDGSYFRIVVN